MKRTILTIVLAVLTFGSLSAQAAQSGLIVGWGRNNHGQCDVPEPNSGFVAIAAGSEHSLGLKDDGSVAVWGRNNYGQCDVPAPNSGFIAIAAGDSHSLGLKALCQYVLAGDLNDDCKVDFRDFALTANNWLIDCYQTPEDPNCVPK